MTESGPLLLKTVSVKIPGFLLAILCIALVACGGSGGDSGAATGGSNAGGGTDSGGSEDGSGGPDSEEDDLPEAGDFSIVERSPDAGAGNRALETDIVITFNKALLAETVDEKAISVLRDGQEISRSIHYTEGETSVTVSFPQLLTPRSTYQVSINSTLMAMDGENLPAQEWEFDTADNIGRTSQATIDECMSGVDLEMLATVNNTRAAPRVCGTQHYPSAPPLAWHCGLASAAHKHALDMATSGFFSHIGSDGLEVGERLEAAGYRWRAYAENIAAGYRDVADVTESWLNSPEHCRNIMSPSVAELGTARVDGNGMPYADYWTQVFAHPSAQDY